MKVRVRKQLKRKTIRGKTREVVSYYVQFTLPKAVIERLQQQYGTDEPTLDLVLVDDTQQFLNTLIHIQHLINLVKDYCHDNLDKINDDKLVEICQTYEKYSQWIKKYENYIMLLLEKDKPI